MNAIPCPYCGKLTKKEGLTKKEETLREGKSSWPFCSERCRMLDFGKWSGEEYAIPGAPVDPEAVLDPKLSDPDSQDNNSH